MIWQHHVSICTYLARGRLHAHMCTCMAMGDCMQTTHGKLSCLWQEVLCKLVSGRLLVHAACMQGQCGQACKYRASKTLCLDEIDRKLTRILLCCCHCKRRQIVSGLNFIFSIASRKHLQQQALSGGLHMLMHCPAAHLAKSGICYVNM